MIHGLLTDHFILHAGMSALLTFMGGHVCDNHFPEHKVICESVVASSVLAVGLAKAQFINHDYAKDSITGNVVGVAFGVAVRF